MVYFGVFLISFQSQKIRSAEVLQQQKKIIHRNPFEIQSQDELWSKYR